MDITKILDDAWSIYRHQILIKPRNKTYLGLKIIHGEIDI